MYGREQVELFLLGREDGMTVREAAEFAGAGPRAAKRWSAGALPRSYAGVPRGAAMAPRTRREEAHLGDSERAAYEAAMLENQLPGAVLADLKSGGWDPASISSRRKAGLGERLQGATDLPLREITRFLGMSKGSHGYHRARLGLDRDAGTPAGWVATNARLAADDPGMSASFREAMGE